MAGWAFLRAAVGGELYTRRAQPAASPLSRNSAAPATAQPFRRSRAHPANYGSARVARRRARHRLPWLTRGASGAQSPAFANGVRDMPRFLQIGTSFGVNADMQVGHVVLSAELIYLGKTRA